MHNGLFETSLQLLNHIKNGIRIRLARLTTVADDEINRQLCCNWGLTFELLA